MIPFPIIKNILKTRYQLCKLVSQSQSIITGLSSSTFHKFIHILPAQGYSNISKEHG